MGLKVVSLTYASPVKSKKPRANTMKITYLRANLPRAQSKRNSLAGETSSIARNNAQKVRYFKSARYLRAPRLLKAVSLKTSRAACYRTRKAVRRLASAHQA